VSAQSARTWVVVGLLIALAWTLPTPYFNNLNNPNENVRVYMTRAMVEHRTFAIDAIIEEWGYVNDKATFDGRMYPGKAPGVSLLGVLPYAPYHAVNRWLERTPSKQEVVQVCRWGASIVPLLAFLVVFARFSRRWTDDVSLRQLAVLALGLGSTVFVYGMIFASHALLAACLFGAWMCSVVHRESPDRIAPAFGVGLLVGAAVAIEYPGFIGAAIVGLHAIARSPRRVKFMVWSALGAAIPIGMVMWVHAACFGGVFETAYSHLENPEFVEHVSGGFFGMERVQPDAVVGSFFAASNGLFWFMPWSVVGVASLPWMLSRKPLRDEALVTALILLSYALFISMVHNWRGGWTAGPRYIVGLTPFLVAAMVHAVDAAGRETLGTCLRVLCFGLVGLGIFACGLSAVMFPHYPPEVANPVFEIALSLAAAGFAPWSALTAGFLEPTTARDLVFAVLAVAPFVALASDAVWDGVERTVAGVVVCALIVSGITLGARVSTPSASALRQHQALVLEVWEPHTSSVGTTLRQGRLPYFAVHHAAHGASLRALGAWAARAGQPETAAQLYRAAMDAPR
jgi:hypothetical protein